MSVPSLEPLRPPTIAAHVVGVVSDQFYGFGNPKPLKVSVSMCTPLQAGARACGTGGWKESR
jgi:hypothetical protein